MSIVSASIEQITRHHALSAIQDVFDRVVDAQARGDVAPQLLPSVEVARELVELDADEELDVALQEVAHAAIATIARIRAARDEGGTS